MFFPAWFECLTTLAITLAGFSLFSALSIALTHFRSEQYLGQEVSRWMGILLLFLLAALQLAHLVWLYLGLPWVDSLAYQMALYAVAPSFFRFSQPLLIPEATGFRPQWLLHGVPILLVPWYPDFLVLPLAFLLGALYLLWLSRILFALRGIRERFLQEITLLGGVLVIALCVSVLGLLQSALPQKLFYLLYSVAIGLAFFLVQTALGLRPRLSAEIQESVQAGYSQSTLTKVDCDQALSRLEALMLERVYVDPQLSLPTLASQLQLSPHQLSELMNVRLGKSFSRYLREQRIAAAREMLLAEPSASVLSVGLSLGFTSQSNFYEAFREIEGTTPGQYRKLQLNKSR